MLRARLRSVLREGGGVPRIGRVALVCGQLDASDATVYTENLVRGLTASGVLVKAVGPGGPMSGRLAEAGAPLAAFPLLSKAVVGGIAAAHASAQIYAFGPDVVHAVAPEAWSTASRIASAAKRPAVVSCHEYVERPADLPWKASAAPLIFVPSESLRENLVNVAGMPRTRVIVIPAGLDVSIYPPRQPERPPSGPHEWGGAGAERTQTVGCLAPLAHGKGVEVFIKAARIVIDTGRDVEFFVAGSGPLEDELRHLASSVGSRGRVAFLGGDVRPEQLMKNIDVFVSPVLREAIGVRLLQAMACSRVVIATAAGGTFDVVKDGETGFLVSPGDERALADRIVQLVSDSRMRSEMGRAGREKLERDFSIKKMIDATEVAYVRAIEEPQTR
jgi:glycosyltransferase involved in cell wall biosynthesis